MTQPLSTDGSALNNVVRELSREAAAQGIPSAVAGSDNRGYRFPDATLLPVDFSSSMAREYLSPREQLADVVSGRLGLGRPAAGRLYRPVAEALDATSGPILVHDGLLGAAGLMAIHRRHPDRPLYLYVHNSLSRGYSRAELRRFLSRADAVVCVSGAVRDAIADRLGHHPAAERLVVVLNGVDSARFAPPPDADRSEPSVLYVGMMTEFKGPHVLMEALGRLRASGTTCPATFVGSATHAERLALSPYEESLHRRAAALGSSVRFVPFVPNTELPATYRSHSIIVVPSEFEDPCPLVLFEGMASGLAALATRRGGIPEIGGDAVQYFDSPEVLAALLDRLLNDTRARLERQRVARSRALELSWTRALESLRAVIASG